jgi:hypothetical protein
LDPIITDSIDQRSSSSTSLSKEDLSSSTMNSSSTLLVHDNFEISKFQILEPTSSLSPTHSIHNLEFVPEVRMEYNCEELKKSSVKDDADQSQQEVIMNMLGAISSKMMANMQHLHDQLLRIDERMTKKMQ